MTFDAAKFRARIKKIFTKKRLAIAGGLLVLFMVATPVITYANLSREISDPARLMNHNNSGIVLKDKNGEVFYEYGVVSTGNEKKLSEISDTAEQALLASEDREFYNHNGYSLRGILGAVRDNVTNKDATKRGGSTITQQLVKNKLLTTDKNFLRKYQELSMAIAVERKYSKEKILEMYLNSVYFGEGAFGIHDAAKTYFNKSPQDLSLAESAMLIGVLPAPSAYSPVSGSEEAAKEQQERVLDAMVDAKYITKEEATEAKDKTLDYAEPKATNFSTAQHFTLMVLDDLKKKYGEERIIRSGFIVETTLDSSLQKNAEKTLKKHVETFQRSGGRNASLVAIEPNSGEVQALVGSVDWDNEDFGKVNMAVTPRQPGSSFKPIYYTEALDKKLITAATVLKDERKTYGTDYRPENYDFKFRGDITVRNALAQSLNIPAIDVMQKLGVYESVRVAQELGIKTVNDPDKYGLSLALGTAETRLYDMVNAYTAFANQGKQYTPTLYTHIEDKYGNEIYKQENKEPKEVYSPEAAYVISSILSDERARAPLYGTSLNIPGHQVAAKTGTTNDNKDAWTIGYTPGIATGVWVGNNESQPMTGLAGGSSAGRIWQEVMDKYLEGKTNEKFSEPSSIVEKMVCPITSSQIYREYFIRGTAPSEDCTRPEPKPEKKDEKNKKKEEDKKPEEKKPNENGGPGGRGGNEPPAEPEPTPEEPPQDEPDPEEEQPTEPQQSPQRM